MGLAGDPPLTTDPQPVSLYETLEVDKVEIHWTDNTLRRVDLPREYRLLSFTRGKSTGMSLPRPFPPASQVADFVRHHWDAADPQRRKATLTRLDFCADFEDDLLHLVMGALGWKKNPQINEENICTGGYLRKTDLVVCIYDKAREARLGGDVLRWRVEVRFLPDAFRRIFGRTMECEAIEQPKISKCEAIAMETILSLMEGSLPKRLPPMKRPQDELSSKIIRNLKRAVLSADNPETVKALLKEIRPDHPWQFDFRPEEVSFP